ncbi:MAG: TIGR03905 family TSCPD domain-containing protein [Oscillospiraceae bacterium]|nr:TIGR03905 family TSCPD domain-containing protein [Oscillospiraceae bacterium]
MTYSYRPQGVCPVQINFDINDGIVTNVKFHGGCNGNLKAISKAVDGKTAEEIHDLFNGIECGMKGTSCSDQLAKAVMEAFENE